MHTALKDIAHGLLLALKNLSVFRYFLSLNSRGILFAIIRNIRLFSNEDKGVYR
jgi:hypothetical protein